ncbi:MAG: hypothetical protein ACO37W_14650 [Prochlorotrichaceae cyanobacterium]
MSVHSRKIMITGYPMGCALDQKETKCDDLSYLDVNSAAVIKAVDLENRGIPCTSSDRICINQVLLRRGQSFSLRFRQAAIDLARNYVDQGLNCLVIESPFHLTLWYSLV